MEGLIAELMLRTLHMEFGMEMKTNKLLYVTNINVCVSLFMCF